MDIPLNHTVPDERAVLSAQGIPDGPATQVRHLDLARQALAIYRALARPAGIIHEISREDFAAVYQGEGRNERPAPVEQIHSLCDRRALFAVTIGEAICEEIARTFAAHEFALGAMLDAAASEGTELTAAYAEADYAGRCVKEFPQTAPDLGVLRFSPGYCGWDMSGQRMLFEALQPAEIGITLNESCLMHPLKSVSGVILAGPKRVFAFDDDYPFCGACGMRSCRERIDGVAEQRW